MPSHASSSAQIHFAKFFLLALLICASMLAEAGELKLHGIWPDSSNGSSRYDMLYAVFETPVTIDASDVAFQCGPKPAKYSWHIVVYDKSGKPLIWDSHIAKACADDALFSSQGMVTITLAEALPDYSRVDVTLGAPSTPFASLLPSKTPKTAKIEVAKTRNDADVYISGTVTPSVGAGPSYSIDTTLNHTFVQRRGHRFLATGQVKTDNRSTADPDSFSWSTAYRWTGAKNTMFQWDFAGMQMDKKNNAMNFYSAPKFVINFQRVFKEQPTKDATYLTPKALVGIDLAAGVEFGDNFKDDFPLSNNRGLGGFFRGMPSASAYLVIPEVMGLKKINITSSYLARIPTSDELFLETRNHVPKPVPMLTSNTRHWLQNDIQFMFNDYTGFEIKHQFGCLPPTFTYVNHKVAIGLIFQFKQGSIPH